MNDRNFITAVILSLGILVGFHYFYEKPALERAQRQIDMQQQIEAKKAEPAKAAATIPAEAKPREEILPATPRLAIDTPELSGSINLKGGRLDDLKLVKYRETVEKDSPQITLLSPSGTAAPHHGYYASFGWLGEGEVAVPDSNTLWKADAKVLKPSKPVKMSWDNGKGLVFERTIAIDDNFMFTITDSVRNAGKDTVTLYPYGAITRQSKPHTEDTYVLHEGPLGVLGGTLKEIKYKSFLDEARQSIESTGGWLGFTDKYWLVTLIPSQDEKLTASFSMDVGEDALHPANAAFQTDFRGTAVSLAPGAVTEKTLNLFAGAKRVALLDSYGEKLGLPLFDRAIDFGWYYYLTKPFLYLLDWMGGVLGNLGLAIIAFTLMLKILTLPLSLKSSRSMAKMKALQPEIVAVQERYKDDPAKLNSELIALYKREKVSPVSGCVPMLFQIPIFFALYKVLYVGMEMRHAPLFGWVKDMSMPDPTSVLTAFGYLDFSFIPHVGVWPILMGISMFLQQKLSPQPTDKSQAQVFTFMPLLFTFMMSKVAVGLIFYWTVSNLLGIAQQWYVMHKTKALHPK